MKVWAVLRSVEYEGSELIGVCDSLETAKELANSRASEPPYEPCAWSTYDVHEVELNTLPDHACVAWLNIKGWNA